MYIIQSNTSPRDIKMSVGLPQSGSTSYDQGGETCWRNELVAILYLFETYGTLYYEFLNFYCNLFSESFRQTHKKIKFFHLILWSSILMVSRMEIFLGKSDINQSLSKIERIWYRKYDHNFEIYQNDDLNLIQKMWPSQINKVTTQTTFHIEDFE